MFPVHPRTQKSLKQNGLWQGLKRTDTIYLEEPIPYSRFMSLVFDSRLLITDSGGIQEETTYLGIPCLTLRPNTERPITISQGTNRLGIMDDLETFVDDAQNNGFKEGVIPEFWDGNTAQRIVGSIHDFMAQNRISGN